MSKIFSKEALIGLVTVVSLVVLYLGFNYLKGVNLLKPTNHYYVAMPKVNDLQISSPVLVDGFKVGIVSAIQYDYNELNNDHIFVQISLDKSMKVQTDSYASLKSGLTSGGFLELHLNKYVSTTLQPGDTIHGIAEVSMMDKLSEEMMPQVETLLPKLDSILSGIQVLVNHPALSQSLEHIAGTTDRLEQSSQKLDRMLSSDVPGILSDFKQISSDFTVVSSNLKALDLQTPIANADSALTNLNLLTKQLNRTDNTLGLLLQDSSLYMHLDSTAINAARLLKDVNENPKKYVRFSLF